MSLGIVVGAVLTVRFARSKGITSESAHYELVLWTVIGGMLGARVTHVLDNLSFYTEHPLQILRIWEGGLGWYGGLIGALLVSIIYCKLKHLPFGKLADAAAPGVMLGLAIGRIGCTINGDAHGIETSLPWGMIYTHPDSYVPLTLLGVPTHPSPVYEIFWVLGVCAFLLFLKDQFRSDGALLLLMLGAYSFGRFIISWSRDEPAILGSLHQSHVISLILIALSIGFLIYRESRAEKDDLDDYFNDDLSEDNNHAFISESP